MSGRSAVQALISKPLFLAVTSTCPFCINAQKLARQHNVAPAVLTLDQEPQGRELRQTLTEITQQRTVPYVFSHGKFIGGFSELAKQPASFWTPLETSKDGANE